MRGKASGVSCGEGRGTAMGKKMVGRLGVVLVPTGGPETPLEDGGGIEVLGCTSAGLTLGMGISTAAGVLML